jgi:hypothetical protein
LCNRRLSAKAIPLDANKLTRWPKSEFSMCVIIKSWARSNNLQRASARPAKGTFPNDAAMLENGSAYLKSGNAYQPGCLVFFMRSPPRPPSLAAGAPKIGSRRDHMIWLTAG